MEQKTKKTIKWVFISMGIVFVLLAALVIYIAFIANNETEKTLSEGSDFTAVCTEKEYRKKKNHSQARYRYHFEVTEPEEIKGETFTKVKVDYEVGDVVHGKYIDNSEKGLARSRYHFEIED